MNYLKNSKLENIDSIRFDRIKQQIENKFQSEYTFRPNITKKTIETDKFKESKEDFLKRISLPKNFLQKNEENQQKKPLTPSKEKVKIGESIEDRLFLKGKQQIQNKEMAQKQHRE